MVAVGYLRPAAVDLIAGGTPAAFFGQLWYRWIRVSLSFGLVVVVSILVLVWGIPP